MSYKELDEYIKKARAEKLPNADIVLQLKKSGWKEEDIQDSLYKDLVPPTPPADYHAQKAKASKLALDASGSPTMWDAFEHVLMFISLYVLSISLGLTLHFFVERWVPGTPVNYEYGSQNNWQLTMLRGYISALIVSYPLFAFFFLHIAKRTLANPVVRSIKSRKFLIYLTLVVAFIVVIGSIISIIYSFLNGNITLNFFLHFCVTAGISSVVFGYYLSQVKEDRMNYA